MGAPGMPGSPGEQGLKGDLGIRGSPGQRGHSGTQVSHLDLTFSCGRIQCLRYVLR